MKESPKKKYKFKLIHVFISFFLFVMLLGLSGLILRTIDKIRSGHGLDYYFTGHGVQMNYISALVIISVIPLLLIFAWIIKIIMAKKEAWEIEKYNKSRFLKKKMKK